MKPTHPEDWLQQLFARAKLRQGSQLRLAIPHDPEPLLVQTAESLLAMGLGMEVLYAVSRHGGCAIPLHVLERWREWLRPLFGDSAWQHLLEESREIWVWLDEALHAPTQEEVVVVDAAARQQLAEAAIAEGKDLYLAGFDEVAQTFGRWRVRPERVQEDRLIGLRLRDGMRCILLLERIRWLMSIERFGEVRPPAMADVIAFPQRDE